MRGYGIRVEGIEHQDIESSVRRLLDREPSVSNDHVAIVRAAPQIGKEAARDVWHLRIDIEECEMAIGLCVSSHTSGAETDNADMLFRSDTDHLHDVADRAGLVII